MAETPWPDTPVVETPRPRPGPRRPRNRTAGLWGSRAAAAARPPALSPAARRRGRARRRRRARGPRSEALHSAEADIMYSLEGYEALMEDELLVAQKGEALSRERPFRPWRSKAALEGRPRGRGPPRCRPGCRSCARRSSGGPGGGGRERPQSAVSPRPSPACPKNQLRLKITLQQNSHR